MEIKLYPHTVTEFRIREVKDACSPLEAFFRLASRDHIFFFDSALPVNRYSRYSFLGCEPFLLLKSKGDRITLINKGNGIFETKGNPLEQLQQLLKLFAVEGADDSIPFQCGVAGYFGYDLCHFIEKLPRRVVDDIGLPDMYVGFYDMVVLYDNLSEKCFVAGADFGFSGDIEGKMECMSELLSNKSKARMDSRINRSVCNISVSSLQFNFAKDAYLEAIKRAKDYIAAGEIYQVNLSQRIETRINIPPHELYRRLRLVNPAPFSCYLSFDNVTIISSSPERFLKVRGGHVQTRPIKGTRPRAGNAMTDEIMKKKLLTSPKDDAELTMIIDLLRNDLGRVCTYGSVRVTERKVLETYSTVHHLVSTIEGEMHEQYDVIDLLRATFPGGSITGVPKISAMRIIDELEPTQRSVYTGSIGYIGFNGDADLNIAIRTFIVKGQKVYFQVGGGIVADSDAEEEYNETLYKARGLIEAL